MDGSGLKKAFNVIFAENSVEKILSGHVYSRAVRGHSLVQTALANLIFESIEFSEQEKAQLDSLLADSVSIFFQDDVKKEIFTEIRDKFGKEVEEIKNKDQQRNFGFSIGTC